MVLVNQHNVKQRRFKFPHYDLCTFKTCTLFPPEEERPGPLDIPFTVALDAGLKDEGIGVEIVVRGDGAVLAAAAGILHHNRYW